MNRFLKHWRLTGRSETFRAHVVSYADEFVILSRGRAAEALTWTKAMMTRLGLSLNEAKTSLKDARQERFDFLGYSFGPHYYNCWSNWSSSTNCFPAQVSSAGRESRLGRTLLVSLLRRSPGLFPLRPAPRPDRTQRHARPPAHRGRFPYAARGCRAVC